MPIHSFLDKGNHILNALRCALLVVAIWSCSALEAHAQSIEPSFNCAHAATPGEHLICSDNYLAVLDQTLNTNFQALRESLTPNLQSRLVAGERLWLKNISIVCGLTGNNPDLDYQHMPPISCFQDQYRDRIAALKSMDASKITEDPHRFHVVSQFGPSDTEILGSEPGTLIAGKSGEIYGASGGALFKLTPPGAKGGAWTANLLFRSDDFYTWPSWGLAVDSLGTLYVTTSETVFELKPPSELGAMWTATTVWDFSDEGGQGSGPTASVIVGPDGALYGTTSGGYENKDGSVFRFARENGHWTKSVIWSFSQIDGDGSDPYGGLIMDASGVIYGTTSDGGNEGCGGFLESGCGIVFRLSPPLVRSDTWTENVIYKFPGGQGGGVPSSSLFMDATGALYGISERGGLRMPYSSTGGGTVFKLSPPAPGGTEWTASVLHSFAGSPDIEAQGAGVLTGVVVDKSGAVFGVSVWGGFSNSGFLYMLTPPNFPDTGWKETIIHSFPPPDNGWSPRHGELHGLYLGSLIDVSGSIYGLESSYTTFPKDIGEADIFMIAPN